MEILSVILVALSGVIAVCIKKLWDGYVKPWLIQKRLYEAVTELVRAIEAEFGRGNGQNKEEMVLARLETLGYDSQSIEVKDAVRAAWFDMNMDQIMSEQKESPLTFNSTEV